MALEIGGKKFIAGGVNGKKIVEIWYNGKKARPDGPDYNLDLNNGKPIGSMHDGELWFRVNVKDASEPFKIAVNGYGGNSYDWDISVDGSPAIRKQGNISATPISIPMPVGKHYVKITPHNGVTAGWARALGNGGYENYRNNNVRKLEFGLERLPGYAFMESKTKVGGAFLSNVWNNCPSLTSMPNEFNLPQGITSVGDFFLVSTWNYCSSLTSMPNGFNLPQGITSVGSQFLYYTWNGCSSLTSMPSGFNLPQGITSVGNDFLRSTWNGCSSLTSMPSGFNIPQGITSARVGFLVSTWNHCSSLTSDSPAKPLRFPNVGGSNYARNCFGGTCPITPDSPAPGSSVMIRRNP